MVPKHTKKSMLLNFHVNRPAYEAACDGITMHEQGCRHTRNGSDFLKCPPETKQRQWIHDSMVGTEDTFRFIFKSTRAASVGFSPKHMVENWSAKNKTYNMWERW